MYEYDDSRLEDEENGKGVAPFTKGYFPGSKDAYKNVGVTIATGVDLGSKTEKQLLGIGVSQELVDKLKPFMGLKGDDAKNNASNLQITESEARELNECVLNDFKQALERNLEKQYPGKFASVPKEMKTVLLSLKYQYGSVNAYNKDFVGAAMNGDVKQCIQILRNSIQFKILRNGQANYLEAAMRNQEIEEEERKNEDNQEKEDLKKDINEDDFDKDENDDKDNDPDIEKDGEDGDDKDDEESDKDNEDEADLDPDIEKDEEDGDDKDDEDSDKDNEDEADLDKEDGDEQDKDIDSNSNSPDNQDEDDNENDQHSEEDDDNKENNEDSDNDDNNINDDDSDNDVDNGDKDSDDNHDSNDEDGDNDGGVDDNEGDDDGRNDGKDDNIGNEEN